MPLSSDHPDFTAALLGEVPPAESAAFNHEIAQNAALQREASALLHTAGLLKSALRQEPALQFTAAQRDAVLHGVAANRESKKLPAVSYAGPSRKDRRTWFGPFAATAGIAAAVAAGLFIIPAFRNPDPSEKSQEKITSINLQPAPAAPSVTAPAPGIPSLPKKETQLPLATATESPAIFATPESIAAASPEIQIIPSSGKKASQKPDSGSGSRGSSGPSDNLAAPRPPQRQ